MLRGPHVWGFMLCGLGSLEILNNFYLWICALGMTSPWESGAGGRDLKPHLQLSLTSPPPLTGFSASPFMLLSSAHMATRLLWGWETGGPGPGNGWPVASGGWARRWLSPLSWQHHCVFSGNWVGKGPLAPIQVLNASRLFLAWR